MVQTASKRGMRREQAEALGPEGEQSNAPATEPRGRREDYGAGNSRWGRERTDERWAPRERGREDGERGSWRSDRNDNFQGRQERATGRGRGRSNQQGPAKGRRSQFSDRDEMRYNEKNSWGRNAEFGGGSQWYDGSGGWESTRRKGKSDAGEENFRMNGLTDDGRSTWVSHGNTWSKWDDDGWGDEGKVKDQGRKGQGNGGRIQDGKEDQEWVAGLGGWDADKAWIDSPAVDTKVSRQDLLDDWLDDDYTSTPSSKSARGSAASASLDDEQRDGPMAAGSKKSRNIWDDGLDLPLTQEDDLSWDSFGGKDDNKRYGATNSMVGALDEQERGAKRGKRGDSRGFTSPAERGMLNVGRDDDDVDPFAWGSSDEDTEVGRWLDDLDAPEVVAKPSSRNTAKAGRGTRYWRTQ